MSRLDNANRPSHGCDVHLLGRNSKRETDRKGTPGRAHLLSWCREASVAVPRVCTGRGRCESFEAYLLLRLLFEAAPTHTCPSIAAIESMPPTPGTPQTSRPWPIMDRQFGRDPSFPASKGTREHGPPPCYRQGV